MIIITTDDNNNYAGADVGNLGRQAVVTFSMFLCSSMYGVIRVVFVVCLLLFVCCCCCCSCSCSCCLSCFFRCFSMPQASYTQSSY